MNPKNLTFFAAGPVVIGATSLITVPLLAWYMPAESLARVNILQVALSCVLLLSVAGLEQSFAREFAESTDRKNLLLHCGLPGALTMSGLGILMIFKYEWVSTEVFRMGANLPFVLAFVAIAIISHLNVFSTLTLRMLEKGKAYTLSNTIPKFSLILLCVGLPLFKPEHRFDAYVAMLLAGTAGGFAYSMLTGAYASIHNSARLSWDWGFFRHRLAYSIPMMGSSLAYWALTATSTFFIQRLSTLEELGKFALVSSVAGVAVIVQSMVTVVWTPIAYRWHAEGKAVENYRIATNSVCLLVSGTFMLTSLLAPVVTWFLPAKYAAVSYLLPTAVLPALLYTLSEVSAIGIALSRKTVFNTISTVVALVINVVLSTVLVGPLGMKGAIISNAISYLIFFGLRTIFANAVMGLQPLKKLFTTTFLGLVISTIATLQILEWKYIFAIYCATSLALALAYRNELAITYALAIDSLKRTRAGASA